LIKGQGSDCTFPTSQQMGAHFSTLHMQCNVPHNARQLSWNIITENSFAAWWDFSAIQNFVHF
jgi:hypothetical protein